jgi:hypothetical protein
LGRASIARLDVLPKPNQDLYPEKVYCLLLCSLPIPRSTLQFILILRAGERLGEYKRCGIAIIHNGVQLTEDCERSSEYRPGLDLETEEELHDKVRRCDAFDAWFKDVEEQEIKLI